MRTLIDRFKYWLVFANVMLIAKVYKNKKANQKLVTIPKKSEIKEGNYVQIKKINNEDKK